ncbi:30S ribosomal protein [Dirofilaria immitis]
MDYSINQTTLDQVIIEHDLYSKLIFQQNTNIHRILSCRYSSTSQEVQKLISPNFASEFARNSIFRRSTSD